MFLFLWPRHLNFQLFLQCLNNIDPSIKYTYEEGIHQDDLPVSHILLLSFIQKKIKLKLIYSTIQLIHMNIYHFMVQV